MSFNEEITTESLQEHNKARELFNKFKIGTFNI